ncbi:hypothetical protein POK33_38255 [Burkholderia cenocepacia]|uniref:hypothetical protein n=1 Tax=Burkholderia cenocepacia TaxID=95486 RepID=UPI0023B9671B|nr:hypothetical protein [Burkholderia cenocepacia]MDF0506599.1 hypothetical protein [Burkholderia cenocepacia]
MKQYPEMLRALLTPAPPPQPKKKTSMILDNVDDDAEDTAAADYASADLRLKAATICNEFAVTTSDELADDETLADRLMMLVIGVVDIDMDGEISDDEQAVAEMLLESMWDYLSSKGVSDDDCDALLNNWDDDAAKRVQDLLAAQQGDDDSAGIDDFAFDDEAEQSLFDSAGNLVLDAVYKKKVVIRAGRKVRINRRISGRVRLSAKQRVAVRKMLRKSHSASAMMRRLKSMRIRRRAGL